MDSLLDELSWHMVIYTVWLNSRTVHHNVYNVIMKQWNTSETEIGLVRNQN